MLKKRHIFNFSQLTLEMATIKVQNIRYFVSLSFAQGDDGLRYKVNEHATPAPIFPNKLCKTAN